MGWLVREAWRGRNFFSGTRLETGGARLGDAGTGAAEEPQMHGMVWYGNAARVIGEAESENPHSTYVY